MFLGLISVVARDVGPGRPVARDVGPGRPVARDVGPGRPVARDASLVGLLLGKVDS